MRLACAIAGMLLCAAAYGQQQPIVKVSVTPQEVNVGESVELQVIVLVPTWFARPPVYPSFELANAITRLPPDSSYPVSERIGGETWSGIARHYRFYPLLGATYWLSNESISVAYANPGGDPIVLDVDVPEVVFRGSVPAGAEALDPYMVGRNLSLGLTVDGRLEGLEAGDALVLDYIAELDGLPAIFLPRLAPDLQASGVSIYAAVPDVEDGTPARRREKVTLVFDSGGEFAIPDFEMDYWNTDSASIETVSVPGVSISVAGPVSPTTTVADVEPGRRGWRIALSAAALLLLFTLLRFVLPALAARHRAKEIRRERSEPFAFAALRRTLRTKNAASSYRAMLAWIDRLDSTATARSFAREFGDTSLATAIGALSAGLYTSAADAIDFRTLERGFVDARKRYFQHSTGAAQNALPPLNP